MGNSREGKDMKNGKQRGERKEKERKSGVKLRKKRRKPQF